MLDSYREVQTPEGVELLLRPAGPMPRAFAWLVDIGIRTALYIILAIVLGYLGRFGFGLFLIAIFVVEWFYPVLFEIYWHGETPGKRWLGLRVMNDNGTPVGWGASIIRNVLRGTTFLIFLVRPEDGPEIILQILLLILFTHVLDLIPVLFSRDFKRWGDLAAGTVVVYRDQVSLRSQVADEAPMNPPVALNLAEQRAVINFAERAPRLTEMRLAELADIVEPVTGARGAQGIRHLLQMANWFLGKR